MARILEALSARTLRASFSSKFASKLTLCTSSRETDGHDHCSETLDSADCSSQSTESLLELDQPSSPLESIGCESSPYAVLQPWFSSSLTLCSSSNLPHIILFCVHLSVSFGTASSASAFSGSLSPREQARFAEVQRLIDEYCALPEYKNPAYKENLWNLSAGERKAKTWSVLRRDEKKCHYCDDGKEGPCGWAYMICKTCGQAFCSSYFNSWCVALTALTLLALIYQM